MKVRELIEEWEANAGGQRTARTYEVHLPLHDAARILALADMFPSRTEAQIITDLLGAALNELEASFPYVEGSRVVAEDEYGDPIHDDAGLTPRFHRLTQTHLRELEEELERKRRS